MLRRITVAPAMIGATAWFVVSGTTQVGGYNVALNRSYRVARYHVGSGEHPQRHADLTGAGARVTIKRRRPDLDANL